MLVSRLFLPIALLLGISSRSSPVWSAHALSVGEAMVERSVEPAHNDLYKRRGGGGGGSSGGGGGGGGRGGGGGGGGGSRGGGSGRGGRGSGSNSASYSSSSNAGGSTVKGSGAPRTYPGSSGASLYYRGGATDPFPAFRSSPSGISPYTIRLAFVAAIFSGSWGADVAGYQYASNITFSNSTSHRDETLAALCLCQKYLVCGCNENHDKVYLDFVANEASSTSESSRVSIVNGTTMLVINGTLANGTTSPGGTDPSSAGTMRAGGTLAQSLGIWFLASAILWGAVLL